MVLPTVGMPISASNQVMLVCQVDKEQQLSERSINVERGQEEGKSERFWVKRRSACMTHDNCTSVHKTGKAQARPKLV